MISVDNGISTFGLGNAHVSLEDLSEAHESKIALEDRVCSLEEENRQLWAIIETIQRDLALDRQQLKKSPKLKLANKLKKLKGLLLLNNGTMLYGELCKMMEMPKSSFSELLKSCDFIDIKPFHADPRKLVIIHRS